MKKRISRPVRLAVCALCALTAVCAFAAACAQPRRHVTVLMYHNFAPEEKYCQTAWTMQPDRLREDLEWLAEHGYATVLPSELAEGVLADGQPLPDKAVMLTFDDGYESNYTYAFPLLQEFGAKAAVALIVGKIGTEPGFLTWDECREMAESGLVEFGSHTYDSHGGDGGSTQGIARLAGETREEYALRVGGDLDESAAVIERELGKKPDYFAYPLGKVEPWANELIGNAFRVSVTSKRGRACPERSLYKLPRYNVTQTERAESFVK